jgi:iron complex transport system permease protein
MVGVVSSRLFALILLMLFVLNATIVLLHIVLGAYSVPLHEAFQALVAGGADEYHFVVRTLRLPRALIGCLAGACLAISGALLQGITRNPLAAPSIVGINSGAALAVVMTMVVWPALSVLFLPLIAFVGALGAGGFSYLLASRRSLSPTRLLVVGVGISAIAGALVTFLLTVGKINDVQRAIIWMAGSVYGRSWEHLWPLLPWPLILIPAAWMLSRRLDLLQLGEDVAVGLGVNMERVRTLLLLISVSLAGAAVATIGTVGFVGLMAPHIARYLTGASFRRLLPTAALVGGALVAGADLLGRILFKPLEIPCGILIALVGTPYMVYLLYRQRSL